MTFIRPKWTFTESKLIVLCFPFLRSQIGLEYEGRLEAMLRAYGIPFCTESQMRRHGFPKTPDACLLEPIAIRIDSGENNRIDSGDNNNSHNDQHIIVKWIESKAWFGDPEAHESYTNDQYLPYYNRFGPGLVIYWFGYVRTGGDGGNQNKIHVSDRMPMADQIIRIQPKRRK